MPPGCPYLSSARNEQMDNPTNVEEKQRKGGELHECKVPPSRGRQRQHPQSMNKTYRRIDDKEITIQVLALNFFQQTQVNSYVLKNYPLSLLILIPVILRRKLIILYLFSTLENINLPKILVRSSIVFLFNLTSLNMLRNNLCLLAIFNKK